MYYKAKKALEINPEPFCNFVCEHLGADGEVSCIMIRLTSEPKNNNSKTIKLSVINETVRVS